MTLLSSLSNRIFLASALLAVVSIGVAIYVVNGAVTRQAEEELRRSVEEAATLVEQQRNLLFEQFAREARLVADLPKLKAAVATEHAPTVQPIAADYQMQMGADLFVVTTPDGTILAEIVPGGLDEFAGAPSPGVAAALRGRETTWFWPGRDGILQAVSVPIWIDPDQPVILGSLSVGFNLDGRVAERFKQLTQCEIAFASEGRVQVSTIDGGQAALEPLLGSLAVTELSVGHDDYVAVARPLAMTGAGAPGDVEATAGASTDAVAIVLRSRTERLQFLRPLQTALAGTAVVAVLAAVLLSYLVARTVTRPLAAITASMREVAATGDLKRRAPVRSDGWGDEDTRLLATTFNTLTESLRRFQQEAAQRERLSSLGRLSTVVAHEIRNPLMIIKTALRALRRPELDAAEVRAAADDIHEEVDRLNRLVSEVLDFARPIKFTIGAVDLNQLCREAAAAAEAGDPASAAGQPAVRLTLDPGAADIRTDRERLRLVLVNLLGNARHAVLQTLAEGAADDVDRPPIELVTTAPANGAVGIVVRDRGVGIQADDLGKVFDPYFTTKRTGSGLGLAIAKNIVEGLGGRIAVQSEINVGTEIRVELPRQAATPEPRP